MTEREICISYKGARRPDEQAQILADLNGTNRLEIIGILVRNGVTLARTTVRYLYRRLDQLDKKIGRKEKEREIIEDNQKEVPGRLNREIEAGECEYRKIAEMLNMVKAREAE